MPKRNAVKQYSTDQYYHIYNRGGNNIDIFRESSDYLYFLDLFKRHLSDLDIKDKNGRVFNRYNNEVELVAFCLMPNHFHLLCYLKEAEGIIHLMRSVMTAYSMYFNKKYKHTGKLYEGVFLASRVDNEIYVWHISRYIHRDPINLKYNFMEYEYSSIGYFNGKKHASWINQQKLIAADKERFEYLDFIKDYDDQEAEIKYLENILASK